MKHIKSIFKTLLGSFALIIPFILLSGMMVIAFPYIILIDPDSLASFVARFLTLHLLLKV